MNNESNKNEELKGTRIIREGYVPNGNSGKKVENGYTPKSSTANKTTGKVKSGQKA